MARSTGLIPRRDYIIDREMVIVGSVAAGARGEAAASRDGTARLINTRLDAFNLLKLVCHGETSNAAGGYLIQAASVAEGGAIGDATSYATIGIIEADGIGTTEVAMSGKEIYDAVKAAGSLTGDVRCVAVQAVAGTGSNGAAAPAGTMTIHIHPEQ